MALRARVIKMLMARFLEEYSKVCKVHWLLELEETLAPDYVYRGSVPKLYVLDTDCGTKHVRLCVKVFRVGAITDQQRPLSLSGQVIRSHHSAVYGP
jgi:hypothetical protein